ncbi:unnamed protein product [Rotaria socialis]|uniref:Uncharacterized protein n=1 Tax=Rotaria socialis TaxID=392032 RepID=A0A821NDP2_9BILA|nr:unnamed protein product [Rotaria socialis]CAF4320285.1 unnamed protein product [Rotaria socialis]CAF4476788.1 unnamed protein product [Rotaria socialis]CAF4751057.1 unnamed protein product [Rotaria socialis]CAF4783877.1 unnamed protein product [Rotaria socialis]
MLAQRKTIQKAGDSSVMETGVTFTLATFCVAVVLFLIATTVVLSLIPIYLLPKTAQRSTASKRSNEITMYLNTGVDINSRRKRYDVSQYKSVNEGLGYKFGSDGEAMVNSLIEPLLQQITSNANGATISEVTIASLNTRRKRHTLTKRASRVAILIVKFYVNFQDQCTSNCQSDTCAKIQRTLPSKVTNDNAVLRNIPLVDGRGNFYGVIADISVLEVLYLSSISPAVSSTAGTTRVPPFSITFTQAPTTTTAACINTGEYYEPITGHTCQTYIDYGFCDGTSIVSGSEINASLAQENCCACGKGMTQSTG